MSTSNAMRQLEERHVATKVETMAWSTKLDLLALSNANGEVALHRLNWLKVWSLPPPEENVTVKGIAWRPDGKVIAIGYSSNEIYLVDVENKEVLNKTKVDGEITSMTWTQKKEENSVTKSIIQRNLNLNLKEICFKDDSNIFLPKLPSLARSFTTTNTSEEHVDDAKKIKDQKNLNLLVVGLKNGKLFMSVFGLFPSAVVDVRKYFQNRDCTILDANTSQDLNVIFVVVSSNENGNKSKISILLLHADILSNSSRELHTLALKYGHIMSLIDYMNQTLQNITEAWENILLEMDSKLTSYASKVSPGVVSSDFLELLMFGALSVEMEFFLLQELTEKGLKKLGHSIEISYSNIQKLVLKHLHSVGQNLAFHLAELRGMARCPGYYRMLGLSEEYVSASFMATGSFLVKATEVQQVIDSSMKKYKAFFRWLYSTILRLSEERISSEVSKVSQQDLQYIAEFLYNFEGNVDEEATGGFKKPKFNLERLGQYLLNQDLEILPDYSSDYWSKFLKEKYPDVEKNQMIIPHHKNMSLVQEIKNLEKTVSDIFKNSEILIAQYFNLIYVQNCIHITDSADVKLTNIYLEQDESFLFAVLESKPPANGFYLINTSIRTDVHQPKMCYLTFSNNELTKILDIQFYLPDVLSILIQCVDLHCQGGFIQFPIKYVKSLLSDFENRSEVYINEVIDVSGIRNIEGLMVSSFAVSGSRKVAVILSESRRKVRLFEMEVEEEEDDDEGMETTTSSANRESDLSQEISKNLDVSQ